MATTTRLQHYNRVHPNIQRKLCLVSPLLLKMSFIFMTPREHGSHHIQELTIRLSILLQRLDNGKKLHSISTWSITVPPKNCNKSRGSLPSFATNPFFFDISAGAFSPHFFNLFYAPFFSACALPTMDLVFWCYVPSYTSCLQIAI